jgi:hypothetical protein
MEAVLDFVREDVLGMAKGETFSSRNMLVFTGGIDAKARFLG